MVLGLVSPKWGETQHRYFEFLEKRNAGRTWLEALIKKMWLVSWDMWDDRNDVLHGKEDTFEQIQQHTLLNNRIQEQFEKGTDDLPPHAVTLVTQHSQDVQRKTKSQKIAWLNTVEKSRKKTHSATIDQQRKFMERWLVNVDQRN